MLQAACEYMCGFAYLFATHHAACKQLAAIKPSCLHRSVCILPLAVAFFVHLFHAIYTPAAIKNNASTNTSLI